MTPLSQLFNAKPKNYSNDDSVGGKVASRVDGFHVGSKPIGGTSTIHVIAVKNPVFAVNGLHNDLLNEDVPGLNVAGDPQISANNSLKLMTLDDEGRYHQFHFVRDSVLKNSYAGHAGRPGHRGGSQKKGIQVAKVKSVVQPVGAIFAPQPRRGLNVEVAPNPADKAKTDAWNKMSREEKYKATDDIGDKVVGQILKEYHLKGEIVKAAGGFKGGVNPSMDVRFPKGTPFESIRNAGIAMGHIMRQDSVIAYDENDTKGSPQSSFFRLSFSRELSHKEVESLFQHVFHESPEIAGMTYREKTMTFGNFDGLKDDDFADKIKSAITKYATKADYDISPMDKPVRFRSDYIDQLDAAVKTSGISEGKLSKLRDTYEKGFAKYTQKQ